MVLNIIQLMSKQLVKTSLSEDELELIEAIRNYKKAYPNGQKELLWYAQQKFDDLIDC